jgi:tetratricopeptide (TPR) repeat protein
VAVTPNMDTIEASTLTAAPGEPARLVAGGRYRIRHFLGEGSNKKVFLAEDTELGRDIAIAFVQRASARESTLLRVRREVRAMARLGDHPNIVTVHDVGEEGGRTYITSQYVPGGSLVERLRALPGRRMPVPDALSVGGQVAAALAHAHGHGIVHRDLKPGNVFLTDQGVALLGDFGMAVKGGDMRITTDKAFIGTAPYMPPEQARGHPVDTRSDLYSLGAMLFELVTGRPPFTGEDPIVVIAQHAHAPRPSAMALNAMVPPELDALITELMAIDPGDRPPSAIDVKQRLDALSPEADRAPKVRAPVEPVRLPPALAGGRQRPFVGRTAALGVLRENWIRSTSGQPGAVFVRGNAGIGKTRLCAQFAQEAQEGGATVIYGRCEEEALAPYGPLIQGLRHYATYCPWLPDVLELPAGVELARLGWPVPGGTPRTETRAADRDAERYQLFEAAVALVKELATPAPLLVVFDDLHWADIPTLRVLRHLIRNVEEAEVLLLCTMRDDEPTPDELRDRAMLELGREPIVDTLQLDGLNHEETAELVATRSRVEFGGDVVSLLWEQTGGNPFYIQETLNTVRDVDQLRADLEESGVARRSVPKGIETLIARRLDALDPATREVLEGASIIGREFGLGLLAPLLGKPVPDVIDALEAAIRDGLVVEVPGYVDRFAFCHALVRVTLYRRQAPSLRMQLHAQCAEALEAHYAGSRPHSAELAHHFFEARHVLGGDRALVYTREAAKWATESLAHEEAVAHKMHAVQILAEQGRHRERCELLLSSGRGLWRAGEADAARKVYAAAAELARELDEPELLAQAALGFGRRDYAPGEVDERHIALLEEALERLGPEDSGWRARCLAALADAEHFRAGPAEVQALSREAVAMARRIGDEGALVWALAGLNTALLHIEFLDERLAVNQEMLELVRDTHRDEQAAYALHGRLYALFELGDIETARREHAALVELADQLKQPLYQHFATAWTAKQMEMAGRFAEAEALAVKSLNYAERAHLAYAHSNYAGQLFGLRRDRGELGRLPAEVREHIGERPRLPVWRAGMVCALLDAGQRERAQADFAALAADDFAGVPRDLFWLGAMCLLAEACGNLGDRARAEVLYRRLEPYAERNAQIGLAVFVGTVQRFLGRLATVLERWDAAERHFEAALERSEAMGAVASLAHIRLELAQMLLARREAGDRERALEHLAEARRTAEELGMMPVANRAAALELAP